MQHFTAHIHTTSFSAIFYEEGHPKSFQPERIRQQYFPQSIHQWNAHSLLTQVSPLRIWRRCNLWRNRALQTA